jgi:cysteine desulfurase
MLNNTTLTMPQMEDKTSEKEGARPLVYLDQNATTPVLPEVLSAMLPYFSEQFGNPSSMHSCGQRALAALKVARTSVADLLGCRITEVVFTGGGTEGNNLAILGMVEPGDHIVTSAIEHDSILQVCRHAESIGCQVTRVGVNSAGRIDAEAVRKALRPNTKLISIMSANNETGVLQPVEEIGSVAKDADVWFHTDAVQAAGKVPLDVNRIGCDLLTITAHKLHGPQGTGALYVRRGVPLRRQVYGGRQEMGRRPGTQNVPGIVGLGSACEIAHRSLNDGSLSRIESWRNNFERSVLVQIPGTGVNGADSPRVPNTSNIYFDHVGADSLISALNELGVAVSRGSACTSDEDEPSNVLMAMGLSGERSRSSIRFSAGKTSSEEDFAYLMTILPKVVCRLRTSGQFHATS